MCRLGKRVGHYAPFSDAWGTAANGNYRTSLPEGGTTISHSVPLLGPLAGATSFLCFFGHWLDSLVGPTLSGFLSAIVVLVWIGVVSAGLFALPARGVWAVCLAFQALAKWFRFLNTSLSFWVMSCPTSSGSSSSR